MKKLRMPQAFTILTLLIIIMALLTWIIPAGEYDSIQTDTGHEPIAGTYHQTERSGQGFKDIVLAPFSGFYEAIDVAAFILMVGAFLGVMNQTGSLEAGIFNILKLMHGREKWMIPILMILFGIAGTTFGMAEETIAFYSLLLPIFIAAGYDSVTAAAIVLLGAGVGVLGSTVNPFATGIAAGFAGVSIGTGIIVRIITLIVSLGTAIVFVMRYAAKVKARPEYSIVSDMHEENLAIFSSPAEKIPPLTARRKISLALFALTFVIMVYSVIPFDDLGVTFLPALNWWFPELSALFLLMAIIVGIFYRLKETEIINGIVSGASDLLGVAFIIGISRGITVIMNNGVITDTILHYGELLLSGTSSVVFILTDYLVFIPLSFLVPSTSGLATLSMPILAPLADFSGVGRDLIITAFQSASGLVNLVTPTSAVVMGGLAIARIPYERWLKFIWKFLLLLFVINAVILTVASKF